MSRYRRMQGARPLLFERLVSSPVSLMGKGSDTADPGPPRLHEEDDLRDSIARELADLLNTRAPLPIDRLEARARSTVDYGIPDLSAFPLGQHDAMVRMAAHVRDAIIAFEPRLQAPVVEIRRAAPSRDGVIASVRGALAIGSMRMPVTFELPLDAGATGSDGG